MFRENVFNYLSDDGKWTEEIVLLLFLLLLVFSHRRNLSLNFGVRVDLFMEPTVIFSSSDLRFI